MVTTSMRQKGLFIKYILPNQPWNLNIIRLKSSRVTKYPKPILKQVGRGGKGRVRETGEFSRLYFEKGS